jgi:glutathionylspermidine synthase
MERRRCEPRRHWQSRMEEMGFGFHSVNGGYWTEDAHYAFSADEIDRIDDATTELHAMCLAIVDEVVRTGDYAPLGLGDAAATLVEASWRAREPALYGRMDLAYDGRSPPKLLEYNADTPTSLLEASLVQWHWLEDSGVLPDQFNRLHEALVERWPRLLPAGARVHFAGCLDAPEDLVTVDYLRDTCAQAGFETVLLDISQVGWKGRFRDLDDAAIAHVFKLYPWEWLVDEPFAVHLAARDTRWIEPAWKQVLSNKSLLPLLWRRFPGHPNLLTASHEPGDIDGPIVAKPRFGREGEGVFVAAPGLVPVEAGYVYQAQAPLFAHAGGHALLGTWLVGDEAVGLGIREDTGLITTDTSRFVPHGFG